MRPFLSQICSTLLIWWVVAGAATSHTTPFTITVAVVGGFAVREATIAAIEIADDPITSARSWNQTIS